MMQMNRKNTKSRKARKASLFDRGLISQQKLFEEIIELYQRNAINKKCPSNSTGQSNGLLNRKLQVQVLPGAPYACLASLELEHTTFNSMVRTGVQISERAPNLILISYNIMQLKNIFVSCCHVYRNKTILYCLFS